MIEKQIFTPAEKKNRLLERMELKGLIEATEEAPFYKPAQGVFFDAIIVWLENEKIPWMMGIAEIEQFIKQRILTKAGNRSGGALRKRHYDKKKALLSVTFST
ncbi:hypothetical protein [Leadbettera azotonutricia]|uniref:Uncharacterized protein n=1 Tax=Leadbettera azotonutricia (strain ATCC BAA-888 / DSM 13862 / ZAS-9) TaxID=545695 RepID=F5YBI5_LEAAZ|nr:hypothetical protein [Leadbettera azotonutricia]AEF81007.1 hypothetical protein TREAZ_0598 [Leadbettera azotonutricia ZAS-9]